MEIDPKEFDAQAAAVEATRRTTQAWLEKHAPNQAYSYKNFGLTPEPLTPDTMPMLKEDA